MQKAILFAVTIPFKKMLIAVVATVLLCNVYTPAAQQDSSTVLRPKLRQYSYLALPKDPVASAFFSFTLPATGQLYNHEYIRSAVFGASFYLSAFVVGYYSNKRERINTDTFYVQAYDKDGLPTSEIHRSIAKKDTTIRLREQERLVAGIALLGMATSYVWGIIDAYQGAKRYNRELMRGEGARLGFELGYDPLQTQASARLVYRFMPSRRHK